MPSLQLLIKYIKQETQVRNAPLCRKRGVSHENCAFKEFLFAVVLAIIPIGLALLVKGLILLIQRLKALLLLLV